MNVVERVQQVIQTAGKGVVIVFQIVLALAELCNFFQLRQSRGDHQDRQSAEGKVVAADADGKMLLLSRKGQKQDRPQIAH